MKKYRCPKDATSSNKMTVIHQGKTGLRHKDLPNEVLHCPTCNKLYRWNQLKEMDIYENRFSTN